jgi:hypothetical protein
MIRQKIELRYLGRRGETHYASMKFWTIMDYRSGDGPEQKQFEIAIVIGYERDNLDAISSNR